ncbi:MAG: transcription factor FapR [Clostridioides sp.]|jgi:hypothetical protein|nr:transcription factor FapR [Clostridioides sp.]
MKKLSKAQRQKDLVELLNGDPFYTDEELSSLFNVSIQTIRLDRMSLNIPELRERLKVIAETQGSKVKTLGRTELVGEMLELSVGHLGISMLETTEDMVYTKTNTIKDTQVFAMAMSIAMAVVDAPQVVMHSAYIKRNAAVGKDDRLIAKAEIDKVEDGDYFVKVVINSREIDEAFKGEFVFRELD